MTMWFSDLLKLAEVKLKQSIRRQLPVGPSVAPKQAPITSEFHLTLDQIEMNPNHNWNAIDSRAIFNPLT